MAVTCHLSTDYSCKEMKDACWESSESIGSPHSLCSECQEGRRRCSDAKVPSFNVRLGLQAGDSSDRTPQKHSAGAVATERPCA